MGPGQHRSVRRQVQLRPLAQAFQSDNDVLVLYDKQLVNEAPRIDPDGHLSEAEERQLWRHYGLDDDTTDRSVATGGDATGRARGGTDTSGATTDDAMTRSEEELRVGTTQWERGRVRLRKYVTTDDRRRECGAEEGVWSPGAVGSTPRQANQATHGLARPIAVRGREY